MSELNFDTIQVGDEIPAFTKPPISRHTLALYCGASGDHNPLHVDIDFARQAGLDDVIGHGMLSMAYAGQALTHWVPQTWLREFRTRFTRMTHIGDVLTCRGQVVEKFADAGENRVRVKWNAADQTGEIKISGEAVIAIP